MTSSNKRLPYAFVRYTSFGSDPDYWVGEGTIEYSPLEHAETFIERSLIFGMTERMADFIRSNCKCAFCSKPVHHNLDICDCGEQDSRIAEVTYPLQSLHETVIKLAEIEAAEDWVLRKQTYRKNKLRANGGKHSPVDIENLYSLQAGNCYYCGTTLFEQNGRKGYHIDHFVSLTSGGTNELQNLVLACPPCNLEKGVIDGKVFIKQVLPRLDEKSLSKVVTTQLQVTQYKKKLKASVARKARKASTK
jgi:5-methylcytosine-specific restriction endonuclease McrA